MPQVDLTALTGTELKRLLGVTRERGQAALTYQILQEMAARREAGGVGRFRGRALSEPRVIAFDFDESGGAQAAATVAAEPAAAADEDDIPPLPPGWVPQAPPPQAEAAPEAPAKPRGKSRRRAKAPVAEPELVVAEAAPAPEPARPPPPEPVAEMRPLTSFRYDPEPESEPEPEPELAFEPLPGRTGPPWLSRWSGPIFAGGMALGVMFGWWAGGVTRDLLHPGPGAAVAATAPAPKARPAAAAREPAGDTELAAALSAPPGPAASPPPPDAAAEPAPSAADFGREATATAPAATEAPPAEPAAKVVEATQIAPAPPRGCDAEPTPADRTICKSPRLQKLQRDLRRAYAEAMMVHQDRETLREHQLAWREARNDVAAPERLARIYGQRIEKLHAAAADARRRR